MLPESIRNAPKAELHLHLRGAMPATFFAELLRKHPVQQAIADAPDHHRHIFRSFPHLQPILEGLLPAEQAAPALFRFESFPEFLGSYLLTSYFFRDVSDFRKLILAVRETLIAQNIVYAEITVSLIEYVQRGLKLPEMLEVLDETAASTKIRICWIVDLVRDVGPDAALSMLKECLERKPKSWCGITLGGSEHKVPAREFKEHYRLAKDHGLGLTAHAGEAMGPESVWDAIHFLLVERIGHGVRSIEDPKLVEYLAEHQIPLEVCPTSNLRTGVFRSYEEHSVHKLYEAGVPISINTDDPSFFDTTLDSEFEHLQEMGFSEAELAGLLENGFRQSFRDAG
jgi:aminodeoxyfutalosine deaminase